MALEVRKHNGRIRLRQRGEGAKAAEQAGNEEQHDDFFHRRHPPFIAKAKRNHFCGTRLQIYYSLYLA
jgi:hypothetical protein